ncbi:hypothetical protein PMAC_003394 [Pneumocystis sp. 'macacae']|nr:hypothetical protein PMAC_003394 [Pneumocystis sp. 'macacae']
MKAFLLAGFLGIAYAFSEKFIHKRSASLQTSASISTSTIKNAFILILKENILSTQCHTKLEEYCKKLQDMGILDKVRALDPKMKNLCKNAENTENTKNTKNTKYKKICDSFKKNNITCEEFKEKLQNVLGGGFYPYDHYTMQSQCILLENACSENFKLKTECNNLATLSKRQERSDIILEFLLRAFSGNLKTEKDCGKVVNEKCLIFMGESDELMEFCLGSNRCKTLLGSARINCGYLEMKAAGLKKFLETSGDAEMLKEMCILFLKKCHFHKSNCNDSFQNVCKELEEKCGKERKYTPPNLMLNILEKEITLMDKIEHKELFDDEIGKPGIKNTVDLLLLLVNNNLNNCETNLNKCYKFCSSLPQLKDLYDSTNRKMNESKKEVCTNLKNNLKNRCKALKSKLHSLSMSNATEDQDSIVLGWSEQSTELDERLCIDLEFECFYLQTHCDDMGIKMDNACANLESACLKTRLFRKGYQLFQNLLKGKLHNLTEVNFLNICINELLELCKTEIDIHSPILMDFCLRPWDTCHALESDIERQSRELRISLGWKRDFPSDEDCKKLEQKCEALEHDSRMNDLPCLTLKERCNHLKNAKKLEEILLREKAKNLSDWETCVKKVTERCNNWSRRKRMRFTLSCIQLNITCQMITRDIEFKCTTLEKNMDFMKVLEKTNNKNANKGLVCDFWEPYCDKYISNCEKLVQDNGEDGKCKKLKENCKSYRKLQDKKIEVMYKLQGNLKKDKCKSALDKYCLDWAKTDNDAFNNFCINTTSAENNTVRIELCQELERLMKERCAELSMKLESMATGIEKSVKAVNELNEIARKALESAKLTLNKQKTDVDHAALILLYNADANIKRDLRANIVQKDLPKYVQQKDANVNITDEKAMAFDAATEALKVYTEVKLDCKILLLECGFKEDCSGYKDSCGKIKNACSKLKALEIKSLKKEATNQTIIEATITETIIIETKSDGTQKTVTVEGQCLLVRTTDRWVTSISTYTRTSTQTSIVTSTMTLTSQRQCKPTKCATKGREEASVIELSEGLKMTEWSMMKGKPSTRRILKSSARAVARAVKRRAQVAQNVYEDVEYLFALVLKKENNLEEAQCKQELKEYCKNLRGIDENFDVNPKLKDTCTSDTTAEGKCTGLKNKVKAKCTSFKTQLEDAIKDASKLTDDVCRKHEQQCLFLEAACETELKDNCNKLRVGCYQKKRNEVADEALLRALNGDLKDVNECKKKIKNVCLALGQESNELMQKCFDTDSTCTSLVQAAKDKCDPLKTEIEDALKPNGELQKKGNLLLEKCHFYGPNCKNNKCGDLKKKCQEEGIVYIPPDPDFDPTEPEITLAEKIGLQKLYEEAATKGVVIGRALERDIVDLLVLLSDNDFDDTKCKNVLSGKCDSIEYLAKDLQELCKNKSDHGDKCTEFKQKFEKKKTTLSTKIESKRFEKNKIALWSELPRFLTENDCIELESDCFYYEGQTSFEKLCKNVKAACYRRGLDALANQALQDKMKGKLNGRDEKWLEIIQKELVNACVDLKGESGELFMLCIQLAETVFVLLEDLHMKTDLLQEDLNERRDFPTKQDCRQLLKKCEDLEQDSEELRWPCRTLKHHCSRLETVEHLENKLLEEKIRDLKNETVCKKSVEEQCNNWIKKRKIPFILACAAQNVTCKIITQSLVLKCGLLKKHIETLDVVKQSKEENKRESVCSFWEAYCDKFMFSCNNLINNGNGVCEELKKNCKPYREKYDLETQVMYEFRGKLANKDKCRVTLDQYCTQWTKTKNKTLESLCSASSANDNATRDELCEKLVGRAKARCGELSTKLETAKGEIKTKVERVKELNEEAKKASESANLILSRLETKVDSENNSKNVPASAGKDANSAGGSNTDQKTQFRLIRRGKVEVLVTEAEIKAFEAVSKALEAYVEVNEECRVLKLECGFKEECPACKDACNAIEKECNKLEPLEVKKHKTVQTYKMAEDDGMGCNERGVVGNGYFGYDLRVNEHGLGLHVVGQNLARGVARAVKRQAQQVQNVYEDEEILLALIVKKDYKENKCKESLEKYCKELKSATLEKKEIHKKLEGLCENGKQQAKCTELKDKITQKCTEFKGKLGTAAGKTISTLTNDDCKENEQKCLFLEGACPTDLKDDCNKLRNKCYQKKRDEIAEKVLLRALSGSLKQEDSCKQKLKDVCLELSGESDELTEFCFDKEKTCQRLITKEQYVCSSLKNEIEELLKKKDELETKCPSLLKKCYFYSTDCTGDGPKCKDLENSCQGKGVVYERPGSDFEPTRPGLTLAEEIELQELYEEAAREGVYIGRPPTRDAAELLLLLSRNDAGTGVKEKCKEVLEKKCEDLKEHGLLKGLCNDNGKANDNGTKECTNLDKKQMESARALTTKFKDKYFAETKPDTIIGWHDLPIFLSEKDCRTLESDCLYFRGQGPTEKPCSNLRAACYKRGLYAVANEALQRELRGSLQGSNPTWFDDLQKKLVKACGELKGLSDELFVLCMDPKSTALTLSTDLRMRAIYLKELLDERRDFPTRNDCKKLGKKCEELGPDSREIWWPCYTLNQNCRRLESAEQLEEDLLKEKIEGLDEFDSCVEKLRERCNIWGRRNRFTLACLAQNVTCRIIAKSVKSKCAALGENMKENKVVQEAKKDNGEKEKICTSWVPYCNKYMLSCKDLATDDNNCKGLKKECETVIKQLELEEGLLDKLKGNLETQQKCKTELDKYCTEWKNATNGLETLCTDKSTTNKKSDNDIRNGLCGKLVEKLKEQCPTLEKKLTEAKKELEEKADEYENIKNKAEDALKKANLVLSRTKATNGSGNKEAAAKPDVAKNAAQFRLVRRNLAAKITEDEIKAFDLVSQALSLYVELKEECQDLLKDCGFKEECEKCKDACNTIENKCKGLKPLEVTEHKKMQTYKMYDRGRGGRRGEAEWGAEDARVEREGGVVGDDDFSYDLEMGKYGLGRACIFRE